MADAKREHDYNIAIRNALNVWAVYANKFDEDKANPYREALTIEKTDEQKQAEAKDGWDALKSGLRFMAEGRGG